MPRSRSAKLSKSFWQNKFAVMFILAGLFILTIGVLVLVNVYLPQQRETRGQASTEFPIPPTDQRMTPPADAVILNNGTGITNGMAENSGNFQVEGYCPEKGLGQVTQDGTNWFCGSYQLQVTDYDQICQQTYNNQNAYAIHNGKLNVYAYNWRCYVSTGVEVPLPTPSPSPTPTPTPVVTYVLPPDQGIHRGCNQYCADTHECSGDLICYYNQCRNPLNKSDSSCSSVPTPSPQSAPVRPPISNNVVVYRRKKATPSKPKTATIDLNSLPKGAKIISIDGEPIANFVLVTPPQNASQSASPSPSPIITLPSPVAQLFASPSPTPSPSPSPQAAPGQTGSNNTLLKLVLLLVAVGGIVMILYSVYRNRK